MDHQLELFDTSDDDDAALHPACRWMHTRFGKLENRTCGDCIKLSKRCKKLGYACAIFTVADSNQNKIVRWKTYWPACGQFHDKHD